MIIIQCDSCRETSKAKISSACSVTLPNGWKQGIAIPEGVPSPRVVAHACPGCELVGHVPTPKEEKGESWPMTPTH